MALSNAERQRRFIAKLKEKGVTNGAGVTNETVNEFMRLKAFAGQLEGKLASVTNENAMLKEKLAAVTNEAARLKAQNKTLQDLFGVDLGVMTAGQFNAILKCLHPDTVHRLNDPGITKQFNEAAAMLNGLRSRLVK